MVHLERLERAEYEARIALQVARNRFDDIINEIPSGIPHPDGALRIHRAGAEVRRCELNHAVATKRLHDYLIHGSVPEGYDHS